jgi:hypothetical protein
MTRSDTRLGDLVRRVELARKGRDSLAAKRSALEDAPRYDCHPLKRNTTRAKRGAERQG